jgi:hypothetical protein
MLSSHELSHSSLVSPPSSFIVFKAVAVSSTLAVGLVGCRQPFAVLPIGDRRALLKKLLIARFCSENSAPIGHDKTNQPNNARMIDGVQTLFQSHLTL